MKTILDVRVVFYTQGKAREKLIKDYKIKEETDPNLTALDKMSINYLLAINFTQRIDPGNESALNSQICYYFKKVIKLSDNIPLRYSYLFRLNPFNMLALYSLTKKEQVNYAFRYLNMQKEYLSTDEMKKRPYVTKRHLLNAYSLLAMAVEELGKDMASQYFKEFKWLMKEYPQDDPMGEYNLFFTSWDEGIPLGNATVGELVWQKGEALRFSLDRTDLWDLRLLDSLKGPNFRFAWIKEQVSKGNYKAIQKKFDLPYEDEAAPSKIPGAAIEFTLANANEANSVHLFLHNALCEVKWPNGTTLKTFVHATQNVGWFEFNNLKGDIKLRLKAPQYQKDGSAESHNSVDGQSLTRLGYEQGSIQEKPGQITYHQKGYNGFFYDVSVRWIQKGQRLYGVWSITTSLSSDKAGAETSEALKRGIDKDYQTHTAFWNSFWAASSVNIPDPVLQKQYDNEMYKFGSAAREHSYPISLQAVWTADNGNLPPWKGDYHHDLNTQLSYWPSYTGNHLQEELGYLNTLWSQRDVYKKYTRQFFEADGMDIPGVCTLTGEPMGGWVQYSMDNRC